MARGNEVLDFKVAKKTTQRSTDALVNIKKSLDALVELVYVLNSNCWYGGKRADKWYENMVKTHGDLLTLYEVMKNFNTDVQGQCTRLKNYSNDS